MGGDRGGHPHGHLIRAVVLTAVLVVAVAVGLGLYADFGELGGALSDFRWAWFPGAIGLTFVNYVLRFWRWHIYLDRLGIRVPAGHNFAIYLAGQTMTLTPAKLGEVLKSALLKRSFDVPVRRSAPIVLVERITDALGIVVLALVAAGAGLAAGWPVLAATVAGALALILALRWSVLDRFAPIAEARAAAGTLLGPGLLLGMTALGAVAWFLECLAAYVCVRGLELDLSLADTVIAFSVGSLAGAISFLPGGLGAAEASLTGLFRALGDVSAAGAAAAAVLVRLATLWFAVALGLVALGVEARLAGRIRARQPVPAEPPGRRSSMR